MNDKLPNFLITLLPVVLKLSVKIPNKVRFSTGPSCLSQESIKRPDVSAQLLLGLVSIPEISVPEVPAQCPVPGAAPPALHLPGDGMGPGCEVLLCPFRKTPMAADPHHSQPMSTLRFP